MCSHGGNTKETVEAAHLAKDLGAAAVAMTHTPLDQPVMTVH
ncbi:MAG: hypothetical protein ACLUJR_12365 [Mediterraneibacter gnavus]